MKNETIRNLLEVSIAHKCLPLGTMAEEEALKLISTLCLARRGKARSEDVIEEAVDTIVGSLVLLLHLDVSWTTVEKLIAIKTERMLHRYAETGEL